MRRSRDTSACAVEAVEPAQPGADCLVPPQPRARQLHGIHVGQLEVGEPAVAVAHDREDGDALHGVLEEPRVAFLRRLETAEVAQGEHHQQCRRDEDEQEPLDRRERQLEVARETEPGQRAVGEDDPGGGQNGVDQGEPKRQPARHAPPAPSGLRPVCHYCCCHGMSL